ncbi:hypothetical protein DSO57_1011070 [Entomophthora muscae]|uniref:Uncharacterized protein n=1 Tax=Entomophthora muscae TaxID=34485 RepID=A0ACC2TTC7_9FUNG|nr:hypothetical protein DSO57_1011070 [Entomophthora muscae]
MPTSLSFLSRSPLGGSFEQLSQSCTGWHLVPPSLTAPKPSPKPSSEQSPAHSTGGEKSDGTLKDHSFYQLASEE